MAGISTLTVNYRSHASILPEPGRMPEAKGQSDAGSDQPPSAMERPVRATADRLDNLGKALHSTAAAAKALSVPSVADPVDFAAGEEAVRDYFKARLDENHKVEHAARDVLAKGEASELPAHLAEAELQKLSALDLASEPEVQEQARALMDDTLNQLQSAMPEARLASAKPLNPGQQALANYSAFYKEFNDTVLANMEKWVASKDGGKEFVISQELYDALNNLFQKYGMRSGGHSTLYTVPVGDHEDSHGAPRDLAWEWADKLGLPRTDVSLLYDGGKYSWHVRMDVAPLFRMMTLLRKGQDTTLDAAGFQNWQTAFSSHAKSLEDALQVFVAANPKVGFFDQLEKMIRFIKSDYLKVYEGLVKKYSDFYTEFNQQVMAKMGGWVTGKDDGKKVELDGGLYDALSALREKYAVAPAGAFYPLENAGPASKDDATKWAIAMGLITEKDVVDNSDKFQKIVQQNGSGWNVMMDLSSLDSMLESLPSERRLVSAKPLKYAWSGKTETWDSASFQSWQTGFNSNESDLKNQLQMFSTKYGSANSYYENFNKILSSQLAQYADMLKGYLS